jgi:hypothetical protein
MYIVCGVIAFLGLCCVIHGGSASDKFDSSAEERMSGTIEAVLGVIAMIIGLGLGMMLWAAI